MAQAYPILPLDRAASNRRRSRVLVGLLCLAALPSVAYVGQYLAFVFLLWMLPVFGGLGLVAFFALDALLVLLLLAVAFSWMYRNATRDLLRALQAAPLHANETNELRRAGQNMAIAAGHPPPALYLIDSPAANLLAVGLEPGETAIVATTGLLELLDRRELEAAVAHATAQIANGDTRLDTLLAAGVRWLRLPGTLLVRGFRALARFAGRFGMAGWGCFLGLCLWLGIPLLLSVLWGFQDPDIRPLAALSAAFLIYVFAGAPIVASLLARVVMRERKHLADAEAVQLTRYPVGLVRALAAADAAGSSYAGAPAESANLHVLDPIPTHGWRARLLDSHPPVADRIAAANRLGGMVPPQEAVDARNLGLQWAASRASEPPALLAPPDTSVLADREPAALNLIRVLEPTPLLTQPAPGAAVRSNLAPGTRVTVLSTIDRFLEVVTPADEFGFIPAGSPFEEVPAPAFRPVEEQAAGDA